MARHIIINGVDRFADYLSGLEVVSALTYAMDTARFVLKGDEPIWGSVVYIEDDDMGRIFGGIIQKPKQIDADMLVTTQRWEVECDDFTALLNQKTVMERYEDRPASEIFLDVAARYAPGFTVADVLECTDNIEYLDLIDVPVGEAFTTICDQVGWHWYPDPYKGLHFFSLTDAEPAPITLTPGGNFTNLSRSTDGQGVKNRILVRGGMGEGDSTITRQWVTVANVTEWTMDMVPRKLHAITLDGDTMLVGWAGLDDEAQYDFMANASSRTLKATSRISEPVGETPAILQPGLVIVFTYYPEVPIIVTVDDLASQAAMAAIFGGDGVIEAPLVDSKLVDLQQATQAGMAELRRWANPRVSVQFKSHATGWRAGQVVSINLDDHRNIIGEYLIQETVTIDRTSDDWQTTVKAGSTLFGLADFLRDLNAAQKAKRPTEQVLLNKVHVLEDSLTLSDSMESVTVAPGTGTPEVGYGEVGVAAVA